MFLRPISSSFHESSGAGPNRPSLQAQGPRPGPGQSSRSYGQKERFYVYGCHQPRKASRLPRTPLASPLMPGARIAAIQRLQLDDRGLTAELEHLDVGVHDHALGLERAGDLDRPFLARAEDDPQPGVAVGRV